jgi:hypothetical protein
MCQARILRPNFRKRLYVALVPLLISSFGCTQVHTERRAALARRILPEESDTTPSRSQEGREASAKSVVADTMVQPASASQPEAKETNDLPPALEPTSTRELGTPKPPEPSVPASRDEAAIDSGPGKPIDLPEAIGLAFRYQPRLRVYLETIEQARGLEGVAFSPFLPTLGGGYSVGGFDLRGWGVSRSGSGASPASPCSRPASPCPSACTSALDTNWRN